jgi:hypothetical protein
MKNRHESHASRRLGLVLLACLLGLSFGTRRSGDNTLTSDAGAPGTASASRPRDVVRSSVSRLRAESSEGTSARAEVNNRRGGELAASARERLATALLLAAGLRARGR